MGGSAFGSRCGPRLSKAEYDEVKAKAEGPLRQLFSAVCTPPVDPEKQDFGDVDFVVFGHLNQAEQDDATLAAALNAVDHKSSGATLHVLVRLDCATEPPRFAQIDIKRCADLAVFDMSVLLDSYSKLGHILGSLLYIAGLRLTSKGLNISEAKYGFPAFLLTQDPEQVMHHLGLPAEQYKAGFISREALFEWLELARIGDTRLVEHYRGYVNPKDPEMMQQWFARRLDRENTARLSYEKIRELQEHIALKFNVLDEYTQWRVAKAEATAKRLVEEEKHNAARIQLTKLLNDEAMMVKAMKTMNTIDDADNSPNTSQTDQANDSGTSVSAPRIPEEDGRNANETATASADTSYADLPNDINLQDPQLPDLLRSLVRFQNDTSQQQLSLPASLTVTQRKTAHMIAEKLDLVHKSTGAGDARHIVVLKKPSANSTTDLQTEI